MAIYLAFSNSQAGGLVLQLAAKKNSETLINLCVLLGADVREKNQEGLTALHVAGYLGSDQAISALIKKGANPHLSFQVASPAKETPVKKGVVCVAGIFLGEVFDSTGMVVAG